MSAPGTKMRAAWTGWKAWKARQSRIGRISVWLVLFIVAALLQRLAGFLPGLNLAVMILCSIPLAPLALILLYRWVTRRLLWKVSNRLVVTYLLMGLAPIVLFATFGGIAAYFMIGQYATNTALTAIDEASLKVRDQAASQALFGLSDPGRPKAMASAAAAFVDPRVSVAILQGTHWKMLGAPGAGAVPAGSFPMEGAAGALTLPFRGVVDVNGKLYLCAESSLPQSGTVLGSMPLDAREMEELATGLGNITVISGFSKLENGADDVKEEDVKEKAQQIKDAEDKDGAGDAPVKVDAPAKDAPAKKEEKFAVVAGGKKQFEVVPSDVSFGTIAGGKVAPAAHFFDVPVVFSTQLPITSWATGKSSGSIMVVRSRPTLLYAKLFASAVGLGTVVRWFLVGVTVFFGLLELFALMLAIGLSRTITRSIAELYRGTREIDAGNLGHRVKVARNDQLGALAGSFNGMAASVSELLVQQREQQRLLNELAIAQEVQETLFPVSPALLGGLEMHALNVPARTVGGDYYDFIFGSHSGLCLALGDISGKGISAALLMASLHSAVRAFSLGQDEGEGQPSPALLLKLLNRHLLLSTQSARYATLFLAFYDQRTHSLTYSNGGHLPPVVLSVDGTVRRLTCGGSVVGLLEDLEYEQATVQLAQGDLLIAFTDGLTEPERQGAEFGEARLLENIRRDQGLALPLLATKTLKTLQEWIGTNEQPDDMTILLARQL